MDVMQFNVAIVGEHMRLTFTRQGSRERWHLDVQVETAIEIALTIGWTLDKMGFTPDQRARLVEQFERGVVRE